ncbi:hypothetical protein ATANTOWER_002209 [Ataeniobius toweri]|uniref:Uncharacterized protein n=1 Tax=Ataeniobius toweri TaxID=208326 RepID=A0ABU7A4S8_9TELE|nr:hypothetical protein [Ataeniobius toweri]
MCKDSTGMDIFVRHYKQDCLILKSCSCTKQLPSAALDLKQLLIVCLFKGHWHVEELRDRATRSSIRAQPAQPSEQHLSKELTVRSLLPRLLFLYEAVWM